MAKTIIGLTGCPGSGKTEVAHLLQKKGAWRIDVDEAGRWAVDALPQVQFALRSAFGDEFFPDGHLDRQRLGKLIFADSAARSRLNAIVHPPMIQRMHDLLHEAQTTPSLTSYIVLDAALLFELQLNSLCDWVVTVAADKEIRIQRICRRDGLTRKQVIDRMHAQLAEEEKIRQADYVLNNSGTMRTLSNRVAALHRWILARIAMPNET